MRDFEKLVSDTLGSVPRADRDEIVRELSGHLQDRYDELRAVGVGEDEAAAAVLVEVGDWQRLRRGIMRAKEGDMTARAKTILIPGAIAFFVAALSERVLWQLGYGPAYLYQCYLPQLRVQHSPIYANALPLLLCLMFAGALAAALSRAAGGTVRQRLLAAEIPAACALGLFLFILFVSMPIEMYMRHRLSQPFPSLLSWLYPLTVYLASSVALPAVALLLGAIPFVMTRGTSPQADKPSPV
jgi:hypothetical protein